MTRDEYSDLEHVRKRPSMYLGDTTVRGLTHLVGELLSNSVDQFLKGSGSLVSVQYEGRKTCVFDDGAGMPFDQPSGHGNNSLMTDYLTRFHNSPSAGGHAPHIHLHSPMGVGLFVVAALSESLQMTSVRGDQVYSVEFSRGRCVSHQVTPVSDSELVWKRGTEICFSPDAEIFGEQVPHQERIHGLMQDAAYLFPGFKLHHGQETFHAPEGLAALARVMFEGAGSIAPFAFEATVDEVRVQAAAIGDCKSNSEPTWTTWSNGMNTFEHGSHKTAFQSALSAVGWSPDQVLIHVVMNEPQWAGPTKTELIMPEKVDSISKALEQALREFLDSE